MSAGSDGLAFNFAPPEAKTRNVLNARPVCPPLINEDWNPLILTMLSCVSQPEFTASDDCTNGPGDATVTAWLSPADARWVEMGRRFGSATYSATDDNPGADKWEVAYQQCFAPCRVAPGPVGRSGAVVAGSQ